MAVSQSPSLSSIDLSGLAVEVAEAVAQVVDFCRNQARSDPSGEQWHFVSRQFRRQFFTVAQAVDSRPVQPFSPQAQSNG